MTELPLVRLLSMALRTSLETLHSDLAKAGFPELKPTHGYAINAIDRGVTTASALAVSLGMTKQGAAKVLQLLVDEGYVRQGVDPRDSRNRPFSLTRRGRAAVKASVRIQDEIQRRWETHLSHQEVSTLVANLESLVRAENAGELPPVRPGW